MSTTKTMKTQRLFVPISRVDTATRVVEGYCYVNAVVGDGIDLTRKSMVKASEDYMKWGAIRAMHGPVAAGFAEAVTWDDKGCFLRAKITDDAEWAKCADGTYKGFSVGVNPVVMRGNKTVSVKWVENSLVDRPFDEDAAFVIARAEGITADSAAEDIEVTVLDEDEKVGKDKPAEDKPAKDDKPAKAEKVKADKPAKVKADKPAKAEKADKPAKAEKSDDKPAKAEKSAKDKSAKDKSAKDKSAKSDKSAKDDKRSQTPKMLRALAALDADFDDLPTTDGTTAASDVAVLRIKLKKISKMAKKMAKVQAALYGTRAVKADAVRAAKTAKMKTAKVKTAKTVRSAKVTLPAKASAKKTRTASSSETAPDMKALITRMSTMEKANASTLSSLADTRRKLKAEKKRVKTLSRAATPTNRPVLFPGIEREFAANGFSLDTEATATQVPALTAEWKRLSDTLADEPDQAKRFEGARQMSIISAKLSELGSPVQ